MTTSSAHKPRHTQDRLSLRGPIFVGLLAVLAFFGIGIGAASVVPIDKGASLSGTIIVETKTRSIQHVKGGNIGQVHVREGATIAAGDLIATLDTTILDEQIGALRTQSRAAARQLDLIRQEAQSMNELLSRQLAQRSRVLALERQVAEVEKESAGILAKIAVAEQELRLSEIRAPVSGRILSLAVHGAGEVISPGSVIAEIVPQDEKLVVEGRLAPALIDLVRPGQKAKVWLTGLSWREARPLAATVAWVSPDTVEDKRSGLGFFQTRIELDETRTEIAKRFQLHPGQRSEILVLTGERTLLDQVLDPILRNINRAFRA